MTRSDRCAVRMGCMPLLLLMLLLAAGCGGSRRVLVPEQGDLAWPADAPRVRLEGIIPLNRPQRPDRLIFFQNEAREPTPNRRYQRPYGLAFDGDDLLVTDPDRGHVSRIRPDGRTDFSRPGQFRSPIGVASCEGQVVVTDARDGSVTLLTPDLQTVVRKETGLQRPTGVGCRAGRVFVTDTAAHQVLILEPDGTRTVLGNRGPDDGQFNYPTVLAAHPERNTLFVGDSMNFRIQVVDSDSLKVRHSFGSLGDAPGDLPRIKGIAVDAEGNLWITDAYLRQVALFAADGTYLISLGAGDRDGDLFNFPSGVAAHPDGRIAIVDSLNRRVLVFRLLTGNSRERTQ